MRRLDRLDHVFIDHDLKAAALWANVPAQLRRRRGCRWLWLGERLRVRVRDLEEQLAEARAGWTTADEPLDALADELASLRTQLAQHNGNKPVTQLRF